MIEEREKQFSIYEVPLSLVEHGLDDTGQAAGAARRPAGPLAME